MVNVPNLQTVNHQVSLNYDSTLWPKAVNRDGMIKNGVMYVVQWPWLSYLKSQRNHEDKVEFPQKWIPGTCTGKPNIKYK